MTVQLSTSPTYKVDISDVVYSSQSDIDWKARVFRPVGASNAPTLLHVHGGAWTRGDRTRNTVLCEALAARGVLVAAIDVHHPPIGGYPEAMCDVNVGARWLKQHAAEFGGSSTIGAIGTSSGGHQAILLGMQPQHPVWSRLASDSDPDADIDYAVAIWPVIDPVARFALVQEQQNEDYIWAHTSFWGDVDAMADGSPQVLLDNNAPGVQTPPVLIVQREIDKLHPLDMAERFVATYRRHGGDADIVVLPDLPPMFRMDASGQRLLDVVLPFVAKHA